MSMGFKVVINATYGGFGLSDAAEERLKAEGMDISDPFRVCRHDPRLVRVVEEMGAKAALSKGDALTIEEVEGDRYYITEYDGWESIVTPQDVEKKWIVVK